VNTGELYRRFLGLRELAPAERGRELAALERDEPDLARELSELLRADDESADFLASPALGSAPGWNDVLAGDSAQLAPERIGRYRIQGILGQGGMGVVYRAEQESPRRTVALKVLRSSLATPRRLKRFEHEAELLARLQHPSIAQVYEAGTVESEGRPRAYIAMELVRGVDLRTHARSRRPGPGELLQLLVRMAEAVAHAHQKGVVHRDLKPENVLIDEGGRPRIVDFGVARLIDADSDLATLHTEEGRLVGTPWYMSPEQLSGRPDAADTRSDVYALGVIAHELCAGALPYPLEKKSLAEVARVIQETEPAPLAAGTLPADLSTVIRKCLEKDPERRYGSAAELAADLRRVQRSEPIAARPPSGVYLLKRFVRRNRGLALGAALALFALVLGSAGVLVQARRVKEQRDRALEAEGLARERLAQAELERDKFEASFEFLKTLLTAVDPARSGNDARVADVLARGSESLPRAFPEHPEHEADLRRSLGAAYRGLGLFEEALRELRLALALLEGGDPGNAALYQARSDVALLLNDLGRYDEAEPLFRSVLEHQRATLGPWSFDTLVTLNNLGVLLGRLGRLSEAETMLRELLEHAAGLERDESTLRLLGPARRHLAGWLEERGDLLQARALLEESLRELGQLLPESDAEVLATHNALGSLSASEGDLPAALEHMQRALTGYSALREPGHPSLLTLQGNLGTLLVRAGPAAEGEELLRAALEGRRAALGPEHAATLTTASNLGSAWIALGRLSEAEELLSETRAALERTLPAGHWMPSAVALKLGECLLRQERLEEARQVLEASHAGLSAALGPAAEKTRSARELLIEVAGRQGDEARVDELRAESPSRP
jgi:tetratricopeptide (TPR) repeat protein